MDEGPKQYQGGIPMKRLVVTAVVATMMAGLFASLAGAFTMSEKVVVANELIAVARVGANGMSAQERINQVNERLAYILGYEPLDAASIKAVRDGDSMVIMVGESALITVTPADARANSISVSELTGIWLQNARKALPLARPTPGVPG